MACFVDGGEPELRRLRAGGFPARPARISLSVYHDLVRSTIDAGAEGGWRFELVLRDEIAAPGLQFNLAPVLNVFPEGSALTLGMTKVGHEFRHMKRGRVRLDGEGALGQLLAQARIGQTVAGLLGTADIQLGPPSLCAVGVG